MMPPREAVIEFARWLAADDRRLEELHCYFAPVTHLVALAEYWYDTYHAAPDAVPTSLPTDTTVPQRRGDR